MPKEEKMSTGERRKYLKLVVPRYEKAKRRERGELLTEMGEVTGLTPQESGAANANGESGSELAQMLEKAVGTFKVESK